MSLEDVEIIKDIPFSKGSNKNFTLHLPDADRKAKHPINKNYIKVIEKIKEAGIQNLQLMSMGRLHSDLREIYPENTVSHPSNMAQGWQFINGIGFKTGDFR